MVAGHPLTTLTPEQLAVLAVEQSADAIIVKTLEGEVLSWNHGAETMFGWSRHEILGQNIVTLFPRDRLFEEDQILRTLQAGGDIRHFPTQRVRRDGQIIDVSVCLSPIRDQAGQIIGISKIVRNISTEVSLKRTADQLALDMRHLSDANPEGMAAWNADCTLRAANAAYAQAIGFSVENAIGRSIEDLLGEEMAARARPLIQKALGGQPITFERSRIRSDGKTVIERVTYVSDGHVKAPGLLVYHVDVTAQRKAEAEARNLAERFERLYTQTPAILHVIDAGGHLRYVSNEWCRRLGYQREDVVGRHVTQIMTPASRLKAQSTSLPQFLLSGGEFRELDYEFACADGSVMEGLLSAAAQLDAQGHFDEGLAVIQDVTQRNRAQRALDHNRRLMANAEHLANVGAWSLDLATRRLTWSEQTFHIYEIEPGQQPSLEEALGFYSDTDARQALHRLDSVGAGGAAYEIDACIVTAKGNTRWVRVNGAPELAEDGQVVQIFGAIQDITNIKEAELALADVAGRFRSLYERTPTMLHSINAQGYLLSVSDHWLEIMGYERHEVIGRPSIDFMSTESQRRARMQVLPRFFRTGVLVDEPYQLVRKDGAVLDVLLSAVAERNEDGQFERSLAVMTNVTEKKRLETALRDQHQLMQITLESIADAVITTDQRGQVEWMNTVASQLTGWKLDEARGYPIETVFHIVYEESRRPAPCPVRLALEHKNTSTLVPFSVLIGKDGTERGIEDSAAPIRDGNGNIVGVVLVFHDVSEQRRLATEVLYRATTDTLTGLLNRSEFDVRLERVFNSARSEHFHHALMYIDLDQFKLVNDACGHAAGDKLLREVGQLLQQIVRHRDTLARLGGDEFAVIMEHCTALQAMRVAEAICDSMEEFRFMHDGHRFRIGASIGLVPLDGTWQTLDAVMQAADACCYAAKEAGRNRVHRWSDTDEKVRSRHGEMQWASRLEQALDDNRFVLFGQRIQTLRSTDEAHPAFIEILLRLPDEHGQLILPAALIPAAERFHKITRIDRWVLTQITNWIAAHPDQTEIFSVNISGDSLSDSQFQQFALARISALHTQSGRICLEVTETAAITHLAAARSFLQAIRAAGARVALDDFGAGASSFGYLKQFPADFLKIDGQFVRDILNDPLDRAAVTCFREIATICGAQTIAEFVESAETLTELQHLGIDFVQGFHIHLPQPLFSLVDPCSESKPGFYASRS